MRKRSVGVRAWARLLGLEKTVLEAVEVDRDGAIVVSVRPGYSQRDRCPHCRRRCPGYDQGEGRRRWRALDLGTTRCYLEADAPRVECKEHEVLVAAVPWARHDAGFTRSFEDTVAWLTVNTSKTAICVLMRIAWRTVGRICERVSAEAKQGRDLYAGLKAVGFDEISIRKGQKYLTVVVDHHTGRLVWAAYGRDRKTAEKFLDLLGEERCEQIELVSCDDAEWITRPVAERCANAVICLDPFHIVKAATDALDEIRREVWNEARRAGNKQLAKDLKGARFALWKNPGNLTERQQLSSQASSRPTSACTAPTSSPSNCGRSTASTQTTVSRSSKRGSSGPDDPAWSHSESSPAGSPNSAKGSRRRSPTDSQTPASSK